MKRFAVMIACLVALVMQAGVPALAQGKLDARYTASLAGIPIGKGAWVIDISADKYTAVASGNASGLLRIFASGKGSGASHGTVAGGHLVPATYASTIVSNKGEDIRIVLSGGNVKEYEVDPPTDPDTSRIPVTEAHRKGVSDPMSATLITVPGNAPLVTPAACQQSLHVFDGRMRYDLHLAYKRMDRVKAEKGYAGPVVVCSVIFSPIAGYIPTRAAIKYLIALKDAEIWLAPIAGTRVVVPFKFIIPTPLGLGELEATQFVSTPQPTRGASVVKTQ